MFLTNNEIKSFLSFCANSKESDGIPHREGEDISSHCSVKYFRKISVRI
jgi:hypothetical protein